MRANALWSGLVVIAAFIFVFPTGADATVLVELRLEELAHEADAAVVARVTRSEVRMTPSPHGGTEPHTFVQLEVSEWLIGSGNSTIVIEELGGEIQGQGLTISGTPQYAPGEEVVVFLERRPDGSMRTFGMVQGRFLVRRGIGGAPDAVFRDLEGIAFARWVDGRMTVSHPDHEPAVELGVFTDFVRNLGSNGTSNPSPRLVR